MLHSARQVPVPEDVRRRSELPRVDYADAFLVDSSGHPARDAERWARATLEGAPRATRRQLRAGWASLGLKSSDDPPPTVLGWQIRRNTPDWVLLGADSRVGMPGELSFAALPEGLLFCTFVHHRTPATRPVWAAVVRTHLKVVAELLDRAATESADPD